MRKTPSAGFFSGPNVVVSTFVDKFKAIQKRKKGNESTKFFVMFAFPSTMCLCPSVFS